ncbi:MAG: HIRAN domain-containing protein [Lachnospiraceae bacterium]|jgi:hypothetical protein|nr:HIRAN domain-containing protein [Lachnospiraceae bacterium]MCH4063649.1 HIRAN domain-containing protein [Lachnospiraceae bacterium]MCH4103628.1 HIRAN domain-containing protein [Lachnospiraceae bacterium]
MDKDDRKRELTIEAEAASQLSILQRGGAELPELFTREILLMETMVNGAMHVENIHELAAELHPGDPVKLVLEPDNPHDPRAILVRDQHDRKLGYIPRIKNEVLYHLMDAGKYLYGRVTGGDIGEKADPDLSWVEIYIAVYMQD